MSKKRPTPTPEGNASQLLSELTEANRVARQCLADNKATLKQIQEERKKVEALVQGIREGKVGELIERVVAEELAQYSASMKNATEEARDAVINELTRMVASMLGLPPEVVNGGMTMEFRGAELMDPPPQGLRNVPKSRTPKR